MQGKDILMLSRDDTGSSNWETPKDLFDRLNRLFGPFTLDAAATAKNTKVAAAYYSSRSAGEGYGGALALPWIGRVFCNPPYGRGLDKWLAKGAAEARVSDALVVMLLPARTDTKWFHEIVRREAHSVYFIKGRVKFHLPGQTHKSPSTFPSMVVVFDRRPNNGTQYPIFGVL